MNNPRSIIHEPRGSAGLSYGILSALDPEQRKAAEILTGQVMIIAGPGTGKTRTLTHRIAHLVTSKTARPEQCLALLFTRRACDEMTGRLKKMLGKNAVRVQVMTFRSFGLMVLKEHRVAAGLPRGFRLADQQERKEFASKALQWSEEKIELAMRQLAMTKGQGLLVEPRSDESALNTLFEEWRDHEGWLDEEDLLGLPLKIFDEYPEIAASYRDRFRFISVDEYQDMDVLGYRIIRHLVKPDGNLCVIGDTYQAIERYHGADVRFLLQFDKDFPFTHRVQLTRNYRSSEAILTAASQILEPISFCNEQVMTSLMGDAGRVKIDQVGTDRAEAEYVVQSIEKIMNGTFKNSSDPSGSLEKSEGQYTFSDFAVMVRTEEQAYLFQEAFERLSFPFSRHFFKMPETDESEKLDSISLLRLHAVKGLEFQIVFITGCEDGIIPRKSVGPMDAVDLDEERRLLYVGMTRAKTYLFLTHASKRLQGGQVLDQKGSPFLKSIEQYLVKGKNLSAPSPLKIPPKSQMDLF